MSSRSLARLAILLWGVTVILFAWFFVKGSTSQGQDGRTAVLLAPGERDFVLQEMRNLLQGVQEILDGINRGDSAQIVRAARGVGMASAADVNPALMTKLPLSFKQLGMSVHHDMDALAAAAEGGKSGPELQALLAPTLAKCVGCHAAWRLANKT